MGSIDISGGAIPVDDDGLGVQFEIGGQIIKGRLPLITQALEFAGAMSIARDEAQKSDNWHGVVYVQTAAIGLCWQGPGLQIGHLRRDFGRDIADYGEAVRGALIQTGVARLKTLPLVKSKKKKSSSLEDMYAEIADVAEALTDKIYALIPTQQEVDDAREDFTDPLSDSSTERETAAAEDGSPT